jgi:hypothetical protein
MALLPMAPPTESTLEPYNNHASYRAGDAQETMFDESAGYPAVEVEEARYDAAYDGEVDEVPELISYQGGSDPVDEAVIPNQAALTPAVATAGSPEAASVAADESLHPDTGQTASVSSPHSSATLTANDFTALEERVLRAVGLVRHERQARADAEARVSAMEAKLQDFEAQIQQIESQTPVLERLLQEVESLRIEREQVRQRVERLLGQLDALEL